MDARHRAAVSASSSPSARISRCSPCRVRTRAPRSARLLPAEHRAAALALEVFFGRELGDWFVARTGYTGEDGFEIMLPARASRLASGARSTPRA